MSVVNKMLQDLEQRQEASATADYQPPQKKFKRGYVLASTLVLGSVVSAWYFNTLSPSLDATNSALQILQQASSPSNDSTVEPVVAPDAKPSATTLATTQASESTQGKQVVDSDALSELVSVSPVDTVATTAIATTGNNAISAVVEASSPINDRVNINNISSVSSEDSNTEWVASLAEEFESTETVITKDDDSGSLTVNSNSDTKQQAQTDSNSQQSTFTVQASDTITNKALFWRQKAKQAIANRQIPKAITALEELLSIRPEDFMATEKLAWLQLKNSPEFAIQTLKQGLSYSPDAHTLRLLLAKVYQTTEQPELALSVLTENPPDIVFNPDFYALQGTLAQQLGNTDIAYQSYYQLAAYQPNDSRWWLGLGVALDQQSNFIDAVQAYRKVQRLTNATPAVLAFVKQRIAELEN